MVSQPHQCLVCKEWDWVLDGYGRCWQCAEHNLMPKEDGPVARAVATVLRKTINPGLRRLYLWMNKET